MPITFPTPIIVRTLRREYRLHLPSEVGHERFLFIETDPMIEGVSLEICNIEVADIHGFYRMSLPDGTVTEGTSGNCWLTASVF